MFRRRIWARRISFCSRRSSWRCSITDQVLPGTGCNQRCTSRATACRSISSKSAPNSARHALSVADDITVLAQGRVAGHFRRDETDLDALTDLVARVG